MAALAILGGSGLVAAGVRGTPPPDAPLPSATFSLDASADPALARSAASIAASAAGSVRASASATAPPPRRLRIPDLGVDAPLVAEEARAGELVIPGDPGTVGRFVGSSPLRASAGTTLLAGHVSVDGSLGALHDLARLRAGAIVLTTDDDGRLALWTVTALVVRHKDELPSFPLTGARRLAIVTCGGPLLSTSAGRTYRDNVIAYATPLAAH